MESTETGTPEMDAFDRSRELLKQATSLKDADIEQAIALIRQAIETCPEKVLGDYFKLANYIQKAGRHDDAFAVLRQLMPEEGPDSHFFHMNASEIEGKMALLLYREKRYKDFVWYKCSSAWNRAIGLSRLCRHAEIDHVPKMLADRYFSGAFKKLGREDDLQDFIYKFHSMIMENKEELSQASASTFQELYSEKLQAITDGRYFNLARYESTDDWLRYGRLLKKGDEASLREAERMENTKQYPMDMPEWMKKL